MDRFMALAFRLAKKAQPFPNPRVGAVLVKTIKTGDRKLETIVLGQGYHKAPGKPHAEIEAIMDAKHKTRNGRPETGDRKPVAEDLRDVRGSTLYVTLEPCSHKNKRTPPCTDAIIAAGIAKVVYAMDDANPLVSGAEILRKAGVEVAGPVAEKEARALNKGYIANIHRKPFVAIKMAMSADGKTATRTGDSKWISNRRSREEVHRMRARYDAVMVGANTIICDDPELTSHGKGRDPYRIIVDGKLSIPEDAKVLRKKDCKTFIAACESAPEKKLERISDKAQVLLTGNDKVGMEELVQSLGAMGIKKILIEGGSELNAEALGAGIVDRLYIFIAPKLIGGRGANGVFGGAGIADIKDAVKLKRAKMKKIGEDILLQWDLIR